jgi:hypothetical protein
MKLRRHATAIESDRRGDNGRVAVVGLVAGGIIVAAIVVVIVAAHVPGSVGFLPVRAGGGWRLRIVTLVGTASVVVLGAVCVVVRWLVRALGRW